MTEAERMLIEAAMVWADNQDEPTAKGNLSDLVNRVTEEREQRCSVCAPGYDCERGVYVRSES